MKNVIWLPAHLETKDNLLRPNFCKSRLFDLEVGTERNNKNLCIPCALTNHDFKERIPASVRDVLDEEHTPKAWIDGRRFRMVYRSSQRRVACTECGDEVYIAYEPEER
jgi:hypothetical protein